MLKLTKKADYGLIAMKHLAERALADASPDVRSSCCSAKDVADSYGLPQEALAKILQKLAKAGLLVSQFGTNGGYTLARAPQTISAFEVIQAIEGPVLGTSCISVRGECEQSARCTVREPLRKVTRGIEDVLSRITIYDMATDSHTAELVNIEQ